MTIHLDAYLTAFSLGCKIAAAQVTKPKRAKWHIKPWMKVWELPDGTLQARKRRPKVGKHVGFTVSAHKTALYDESCSLFPSRRSIRQEER